MDSILLDLNFLLTRQITEIHLSVRPWYFNTLSVKWFLQPESEFSSYRPFLMWFYLTHDPNIDARVAEVVYPERLRCFCYPLFPFFILSQFIAYPVDNFYGMVEIGAIRNRDI